MLNNVASLRKSVKEQSKKAKIQGPKHSTTNPKTYVAVGPERTAGVPSDRDSTAGVIGEPAAVADNPSVSR